MTFAAIFLVGVIQVIFIVYVGSRLLKPILSVRENIRCMADGDFDAAMRVEADNTEVGQLVRTLEDIKGRTRNIIGDISYMTEEYSDGNFRAGSRRREHYVGVYQPILESMRKLKHKQIDTLQQIKNTAGRVSQGSEQVAQSADALAQGASRQSSSVEELSRASATSPSAFRPTRTAPAAPMNWPRRREKWRWPPRRICRNSAAPWRRFPPPPRTSSGSSR